ncbi:sigma-54 interaction domain-containing protein [Desulforhopalus singaporensis]|uniref:Arginine utilization regulatory protein n=1 Tax=Desulforhopalus singaporensis TaxID=91360 RepID=A0A1H0V9E2_9BACT|nr:sigma 54-interacting transcriptional regulator [Desulforhopalus singaporensis]SDP74845.1 arginine utilization regulatory protein [Desulforhopalus singaporensis]
MNVSLELFHTILNSLNIGIEVSDKDYNIIFVNDYEMKMTYGNRNVIGKNYLDFFSQKEMDESGIPEAIKTGKSIENKMISYINCLGCRCIAHVSTYPIKIKNEIVGAYTIGEDITGICTLSEQNMQLQNSRNYSSKNNRQHDFKTNYCIDDIVGISSSISELKEKIHIAATNDANVMIFGETGTGKELVAQSIYTLSKNNKKFPFVAFNCAAIPEPLLESIFFGTVRGCFTGAENQAGLFENAQNGVLFLDEINSLPLGLQGKLLRAIQEKKVMRVGSSKEIPLQFRLISASNESVTNLLVNELFRKDLFYRLNVITIPIPPLRNRKEDIPELACHFLNKIKKSTNTNVVGFHSEVTDWMLKYAWMGNVRELKNFVERAVYFAKSKIITLDSLDLTDKIFQSSDYSKNTGIDKGCDPKSGHHTEPSNDRNTSLKDIVSHVEKNLIIERLKQNNGNVSKTARELDVAKQTLFNKIKKLGIQTVLSYKVTHKTK